MAIVQTNVNYTYNTMHYDIRRLLLAYPFLQVQTVGFSVLGRPLLALRLGKGPKQVFYSASFHANEWITSVLLMKFIEDYSIAYVNNSSIYGYRIKDLFDSTSIYLIPMVNPDGVDLVTGYFQPPSSIFNSFQKIANNYPSIPFPSGWKANFNGVDFKKYQPFCKVLYILIYKALLVLFVL